jgi:hypothetical protein
LAFHPYPQVIRAVFNPHRFGPPLGVTRASPCSWVDRPGFGSTPTNSVALLSGLAFAAAPPQSGLASLVSSNSPDHNAKGTQSVATTIAGRPTSYRLWACGFRLSFTPRPGVLFTCPSRYSSAIGHTRVFSLGGWSPRLHARLLGSGVTQELHYAARPLSPTGLSPSSAPRSRGLRLAAPGASVGPTTPRGRAPRFGLCPFRSPLLRVSRLISLPPGTEMFQFPGFASVGD